MWSPDLCKPASFPALWRQIFDSELSQWVKSRYSPDPRWKDKPFTEKDVEFFGRSLLELSSLFTEERTAGSTRAFPSYFDQPKYRSSYLLYYVPLNAAKFWTLFDRHTPSMDAMLKEVKEEKVLRVADIGAGPGTGSIALLAWLAHARKLPERVELYWSDRSSNVLKDGVEFLQFLVKTQEAFAPLRTKGALQIRTSVSEWNRVPAWPQAPMITLVGNVLNESSGPGAPPVMDAAEFALSTSGGGTLFLEPASPSTGQKLSRLRDHLLSNAEIPLHLWGPCLHLEACPLSRGRDWCHFSVPAQVPGRWFEAFSQLLGSERKWLKFSYIWAAAPGSEGAHSNPEHRRIVSDKIPVSTGEEVVLLCEPSRPKKMIWTSPNKPLRGDLIVPDDERRDRPLQLRLKSKAAKKPSGEKKRFSGGKPRSKSSRFKSR